MFEKITFDIEANNLLNKESIDYTASPYKLKDCFTMHCIVVEDIETGNLLAFHDGDKYVFDGRIYEEEDIDNGYTYVLKDYTPIDYVHKPLKDFESFTKSGKIECVVGHNILNFDLLACKLYYDFDYTVEKDTLNGFDVEYIDTLVLSKCLNPDRVGGHSLDKLSEKTGLRKINFRPYVKNEDRFKKFAADMLYYCIRDVQANTKVLKILEKEKGSWDWNDAISLEKSVADIITRQEHRGFNFNTELAEHCIKDLDGKLEERKLRVSPIIPDKPATKAYMKDFTPPVRQFLKTGEPSHYLIKFANKIGAEIIGEVGSYKFVFKNKEYNLPLELEPLVTTQEAGINDTTHIKEWLVSEFGWNPSEYKEKDLSIKQVKGVGKVKRTPEEVAVAIDKYVEQTLSSAFCNDRCDFLEVTPAKLKHKLQSYKEGRAIKVWTNPSFTKGQEKEICPDLERIAGNFPYAKDIVEYLTYKHRRNSILGGGLDWDDEEEAEKGFLAYVREDGRIPTPADTCGAATSRFKHKVCCNIPRNTSLYGEEMRGLFGVDSNKFYQIGYDFDSLEARIEAHYCYPYDKTKEYCDSLLQAKPNDVHSVMARKITDIIGRKFERSPAKSTKYAATYGATAPKIAKTIGETLQVGTMVFNAFWEAALPLKKLKDRLQKYWEDVGKKKFILGIDGRKVPTRSQHAILNSLFQSAGVICAKRAMVFHDKFIKEAGYSVDFFRDDWKEKTFINQLIAYHDEAQLELSKSLAKFKVFNTEDEAKAWKTQQEDSTGKHMSDVGHLNDGRYFVGYSIAGELAAKAVKAAGNYYKLNIELTAGYQLGDSWAKCH